MTGPLPLPLITSLTERADEPSESPRIVLLSAPAGYGKTSAVAAWLGGGSDARPDVLWVRCPAASSEDLWGLLAGELARFLDIAPPPGGARFDGAVRLAAGLEAPLTVVIDDYHHATTAANDLALADLCAGAPLLTLVTVGRRVRLLDGPLVTSRIPVRVFGQRDLSLTLEDALGMAARLGIPESDRLRSAIEQAGGWPLAVRAALSPALSARDLEDTGDPAAEPAQGAAIPDPLANLNRFALHHLEIVGELSRRILLAAAQLDAIDFEQAAEFTGADIPAVRAAVRELIELGLLTPVPSDDTTEFRCHSAVRGPLAARSARSYSPELRELLFRGRAARVEDRTPFTAFSLYCAAGAYPEAESLLARYFTMITDEAEATSPILRAIPESALAAHPTFIAARLLLDLPDPSVPPSTLAYLTGLWHRSVQERVAGDQPLDRDSMRMPLLMQAMVSERMVGRVDAASACADELEARFSATHLRPGALAVPSGAAEPPSSAMTVFRNALPIYYRELGSTALVAGDLARARRNWERLRAHAEELIAARWTGFPPLSTRTVTDPESGRRWLLVALNEMAFTELLDGDMRRCAELLSEAERIGSASGTAAPGLSWVAGETARAHLAIEDADDRLLEQSRTRLAPLLDRIEQRPLLLIAEAAAARRERGAGWALAQLRAGLAGGDTGRFAAGRWWEALAGHRAMLHTVLGDFRGSERILASLPADSAITRIERARLALFSGDDVEALFVSQRLGDAETTKRQRLERCLISAAAAWGCEKREEAFAALRSAAELMESCGLHSMLWGVPFDALSEAVAAAGASGACDLVAAVEAIPEPARARRYERLTEMERRTLAAVAVHRSASQTAAALFITPGTVKKHLASVYRKLHAKGRDEAILQATRMGLLDPEAAQAQPS